MKLKLKVDANIIIAKNLKNQKLNMKYLQQESIKNNNRNNNPESLMWILWIRIKHRINSKTTAYTDGNPHENVYCSNNFHGVYSTDTCIVYCLALSSSCEFMIFLVFWTHLRWKFVLINYKYNNYK